MKVGKIAKNSEKQKLWTKINARWRLQMSFESFFITFSSFRLKWKFYTPHYLWLHFTRLTALKDVRQRKFSELMMSGYLKCAHTLTRKHFLSFIGRSLEEIGNSTQIERWVYEALSKRSPCLAWKNCSWNKNKLLTVHKAHTKNPREDMKRNFIMH